MATWKLDLAHTGIDFSVRHMMVTTVRGGFKKFDGTLEFDAAQPENTKVDVQIETASIETGTADRDNHLRSADFFDVEKFPYITFKSTKVEPKGGNEAVIVGDLTIRDVTREVRIEAEFLGEGKNPWGMTVAGFTGTTKIDREDFGLTWNVALETGGVLVGKEIKISLDVEAVLQSEQVPAQA
jgi:polyisoprenoid-binding protein YceI